MERTSEDAMVLAVLREDVIFVSLPIDQEILSRYVEWFGS